MVVALVKPDRYEHQRSHPGGRDISGDGGNGGNRSFRSERHLLQWMSGRDGVIDKRN
jgi:hypothetical protein